MKKAIFIVLSVVLFLIATFFTLSAVITIFDSFDDYYPMTRLIPILLFMCITVVCVLLALKILKVQKIKFMYIIVVSIVSVLLLISMEPLNNAIFNSWEKHIKLTYDGTEIEPFTKTTKVRYNLQNITNHELKDVVVVFSCKGFDNVYNLFYQRKFSTIF